MKIPEIGAQQAERRRLCKGPEAHTNLKYYNSVLKVWFGLFVCFFLSVCSKILMWLLPLCGAGVLGMSGRESLLHLLSYLILSSK